MTTYGAGEYLLEEAEREIDVLRMREKSAYGRGFDDGLASNSETVDAREREIEVLTTERDNALLERDRAEVALAEHLADYGDPRGGVHPNA
jgi:hypothetical protein